MLESEFESLLKPLGIAGAYIASREGDVLVKGGTFDDAAFSGLQLAPEGRHPWLPTNSPDIVSMWEFLDGKILPQSAAQGDATICLMKPHGAFIGIAAYILPRSQTDRVQKAIESYHLSIKIGSAFDQFARTHEHELTSRSNRSRVKRAPV